MAPLLRRDLAGPDPASLPALQSICQLLRTSFETQPMAPLLRRALHDLDGPNPASLPAQQSIIIRTSFETQPMPPLLWRDLDGPNPDSLPTQESTN